MLADDVIAAAGSPADRVYRGAFTALGDVIREAKRFDLTPGVVVTANMVCGSSIKAQLRALPLCRLPFEFVWIEWPGADPTYAPFQKETATELAPVPQRLGALIHTDASRQKGSMTFVWSHRHQGLNTCPVACFFDWREDAVEVPDAARDYHRKAGMSEEDLQRRIIEQSSAMPQLKGSSEADLLGDRYRFGFHISPAFNEWGKETVQETGGIPGPGTPLWKQWMGDIGGEPGIMRSVIMLLNTKNITQHADVAAPAKLNKQRMKGGKAPLLDHTTIRIKLSRALQDRAGGDGQRESTRLHAVRGHFKIRASGIYWWSDHIRGDVARGIAHGTYRIND